MPGIPRAPSHVGMGATLGSIFCTALPFRTAYSCTPSNPDTVSPAPSPSKFEVTTSPAAIARMTSPIWTGGMYERPSRIHPRMAGSSEMWDTLTRTSPSPGSGTSSVVKSQVSCVGRPSGRAARRHTVLVGGVMQPTLLLGASPGGSGALRLGGQHEE